MSGAPDHPEGAHVRAGSSPIEILERDGPWGRGRIRRLGASVTGPFPTIALSRVDPARWSHSAARLRGAVRVGGLDFAPGTPVTQSTCTGCPEPISAVHVPVEAAGRRAVLHLLADAAPPTEPLSDDAELPYAPPRRATCLYPDSPPPSADPSRGLLSREAIRREIRRHIEEVRACYEERLRARPRLAGRVVASFVVGPTGRVASVDMVGQLEDEYVRRCIAHRVQSWRFPAPEGGDVVGVNYPFVLGSHD